MSKKKRRKHRLKKALKGYRASRVKNRHHCCFIKAKWGAHYARMVRDSHYFIIEIPRDTLHKYIHAHMTEVPVPNEAAAKKAYESLVLLDRNGVLDDDDPIEMRLLLLVALFDHSAPATADGFREQLSIVRRFYDKPP